MKQTCDNCIKRAVCEIKAIVDHFVVEHGVRFEPEGGYIAQKEWLAFLGGRCKEYDNGETKAM